jgi:hypothetical protein
MDLDLWMRLLQFGEFLGLPEPLAAFRMSPDTSSDERRALVDEQQLLLEEIAETETFSVRGIDQTVGRLLVPSGRARRRALVAAAS